jgi:hypothetical protein
MMRFSLFIAFAATTACLALPVTSARAQGLPQRLVKMEYEATLTAIIDPLHLFPEVRVGDPVHGTITYDPLNDILFTFFLPYPPWLNAATMTIENPRGGEPTQFVPDPAGGLNLGFMIDDIEDNEFDKTDGLLFSRSVVAPPGFPTPDPGVTVSFLAPGSRFAKLEPTLPDEIVLDEWPVATVTFTDLVDEDPSGLVAEIHTLRTVPIGPGDFDASGAVDPHDLAVWQDDFGDVPDGGAFSYFPYADADLDGDADGNDFLVWQRSLTPQPGANTSIPEPATMSLLAVGVLQLGAYARLMSRRG